jgi:hypothetical protein
MLAVQHVGPQRHGTGRLPAWYLCLAKIWLSDEPTKKWTSLFVVLLPSFFVFSWSGDTFVRNFIYLRTTFVHDIRSLT